MRCSPDLTGWTASALCSPSSPSATRVRMLALEVGAGQAPAVAELVRASGFAEVRAERDLAGIERVIVGAR